MRVKIALAAKVLIPMVAKANVSHFVAVDDVQHRAGFFIATLRHLGANGGGNVQPTRFQHARHQRHPQQRVIRRFVCHVPQMRVRGEVAVVVAMRVQPRAHQGKMLAFFFGHLQPVCRKRRGQRAKAIRCIQRQVNRVKFNVRNRVQHRRVAFGGAGFALVHRRGGHQLGARGATCNLNIPHGAIVHHFQAACLILLIQRQRLFVFARGVGFAQGVFQLRIKMSHDLKLGKPK